MITQSGFLLLLLLFRNRDNGDENGKREIFSLPSTSVSLSLPPFPQQLLFPSSAQAPRLALRLEQREDVALADGALDVAHDEAVLVVEELDADLGDLFFFQFFLFIYSRRRKKGERRRQERRSLSEEERDRRATRELSPIGATQRRVKARASCVFSSSAVSHRRCVSLLEGKQKRRSRKTGGRTRPDGRESRGGGGSCERRRLEIA